MKECEEVWTVIDESSIHAISNLGRVKVIKTRINENGRHQVEGSIAPTHASGGRQYLRVGFTEGGVRKMYMVHRLVAKYFCYGHSEINCVVNHKDGNQKNNRWDNLEWCTPKHNTIHAHKTGLARGQAGESNSCALLSNVDIFEILELFYVGLVNRNVIAEKFNLHPQYVGLVVRGTRWKDQYKEFEATYPANLNIVREMLSVRRNKNWQTVTDKVRKLIKGD